MLFLASFLIVALGQPDTSRLLSLIASGVGFALFWLILFSFPKKSSRFWLSTLWFAAVQAVQLAWLATPEYQGVYILFVYAGLIIALGLEFGLLSLLFPKKPPLDLKRLFAIGALWTLFEWSRLYILCGFAWNPIGLSMTAFPISAQLASVGGIFGLSFWTAVVNLLFLRFFLSRKWKLVGAAVGAFLFPFLFGFFHMGYHQKAMNEKKDPYHVALIQTALNPHQKSYFYDQAETFISPYYQWRAIIQHLEEGARPHLNLIVLPEAALPFGARAAVYSYEDVKRVLHTLWGEEESLDDLLIPSLAKREGASWYVNNLFWAQAIANHYGAEMILGLDDIDPHDEKSYNAAFHIRPHQKAINRYEKRVLLPLAEYLPFSFLESLVARYGVSGFFSHGKEAKVFEGNCPLNISICYEECFSHLVREGKLNGARLFVNVTNDGWYPSSRLPLKHFDHGKIRAIENGVPLVRACNTGVTAAVDSLGRVINILDTNHLEWQKGTLFAEVDLYSYGTLYTTFGDTLILALCFFFLLIGVIPSRESS